MSTSSTRPGTSTTRTPRQPVTLQLLRLLALLSVLSLGVQFVTAGGLLGGGQGAGAAHAAGAVALHVVSGLAALAALAHQRATRGPWWPTVLAAAVLALGFAQAWWGSHGPLSVHVPGAMALVVGAVWLLAWSLRPATR